MRRVLLFEWGSGEWEWKIKCYKIPKRRGPAGVWDYECGSRMEVHGEALDCTEEARCLEKTTERVQRRREEVMAET